MDSINLVALLIQSIFRTSFTEWTDLWVDLYLVLIELKHCGGGDILHTTIQEREVYVKDNQL